MQIAKWTQRPALFAAQGLTDGIARSLLQRKPGLAASEMTIESPDLAEMVSDTVQAFGLSRPAGLCLCEIWRAAQLRCADDLVVGLGLSRSNVSTALKELRGWGLVNIVRAPGVRKEFYSAPTDPWDLLRLVMVGRERRFIAPLVDRLAAAEALTGDVRFAALHAMLQQVGAAFGDFATASSADVRDAFARMRVSRDTPKKKKKKRQA